MGAVNPSAYQQNPMRFQFVGPCRRCGFDIGVDSEQGGMIVHLITQSRRCTPGGECAWLCEPIGRPCVACGWPLGVKHESGEFGCDLPPGSPEVCSCELVHAPTALSRCPVGKWRARDAKRSDEEEN
ncbi:MAG TPA: hypothetical protein VG674_31990 [Amycolatopsis sp.]|nr:hypothetical protein [Amycolatopsis sp.]